jgi:hypothetical protein
MGRGPKYLALIAMCALGLLYPSKATCGAGLRIETPQLDVGKVKAGSAAVGTFVFHNESDRDITILQAKPS